MERQDKRKLKEEPSKLSSPTKKPTELKSKTQSSQPKKKEGKTAVLNRLSQNNQVESITNKLAPKKAGSLHCNRNNPNNLGGTIISRNRQSRS